MSAATYRRTRCGDVMTLRFARVLCPAVLALVCFCFPSTRLGIAEDKPAGLPKFDEFNEKPREGWVWDEDERLDDLVMQLQQKELALQQVDARIAKAMGKKAGSKMAENMAWRSTQRMDLNGGGPVRWDAFYGRNAENFFYHPKDPNTTYHTTTVLQQTAPTAAGGVSGNQGVPAHQRPPQFDYIYRGYEQAQKKAQRDAAELAEQMDVLKSRRRQLEADVVVLWFKLAFRVIDRDKLSEKPILRWAFIPNGEADQESMERASALTAAARLVATAMLFNETSAENDPDKAYNTVSELVAKHRKAFSDSLLRLASLEADADDKTKPIGQFKILASKLEDASKSLEEGYRDWEAGDENDEEKTKYQGLRRIQDSLVQYAKTVLALNELVGVMKKAWAIKPNLDSAEFVPTWDISYVPGQVPTPTPSPALPSPIADNAQHMALEWLARHQMPDGSWSFDHAQCPQCGGKCRNPGEPNKDPSAATGLVLLAFYGSGHTQRKGDYRDALRKGVVYLANRCQQGNGKCYDTQGNLYCQGIAALALATCYGLTTDRAIKQPAQLALNFIQDAQDPSGGGWRYLPKQPGDTCVTAWQVSALVAGHKAKLLVNPDVLSNADRFLNQVQADDGSRYGYVDGTNCTPGRSAMGLCCRMQLGFGWTPKSPPYLKGVDNLLQGKPGGDIYGNYYVTRVMEKASPQQRLAWSGPMKQMLLATQSKIDHETGSWWDGFDKGHTGSVGGRLLITAFAAMVLNACQ